MATLMRAKTAYTKASSVDKLQLVMDYIAEDINAAVRSGQFSTTVFVDEANLDGVTAALLAAGYSVSANPYIVPIPKTEPKKKSFFTKVMDFLSPKDPDFPFHELGGWPSTEKRLLVDWSLVRETHSTKV